MGTASPICWGPPMWHSGKESTCQCRRHRRCGFEPWAGKIPWRRKQQPTAVFLPEKSHGQKSLVGQSPWGHKESDITEGLRMCWSNRSICVCLWCRGSCRLTPYSRPSVEYQPGVKALVDHPHSSLRPHGELVQVMAHSFLINHLRVHHPSPRPHNYNSY